MIRRDGTIIGGHPLPLAKPPPRAIRGEHGQRENRCYELAAKAVLAHEGIGLVIVHGYYPISELSPGSSQAFGHAWVIDPRDDTVFDTRQWKWFEHADYLGVECMRYTRGQLKRKIKQHNWYGVFPDDWGGALPPEFVDIRKLQAALLVK